MVPKPKPFEYKQDSSNSPYVEQGSLCKGEQEESSGCTTKLVLEVLGIFGQDDDDPTYDTPESEGMLRYRLNTTDPDDEEYDPALFVPIDGLMYGDEAHEFYHNDMYDKDEKIGDRAILFQSLQNYETVSKNEDLSSFFPLSDRKSDISEDRPLTLTDHMTLRERILEYPRFGEQVIVDGAGPSDISVGDIFEVAGEQSTLKVQVTSPRKPCCYLDKKNKTPRGAKGAKTFTCSRGLAGWFTSVLVAGELHDGMKLVRTHHPHPKWTLENISQALFGGEGDPKAVLRGAASWGRSKEDLQELLDMDVLAECDWKEEVVELMKEIEDEEKANTHLSFSEELLAMLAKLMVLFNTVFYAICAGHTHSLGFCYEETTNKKEL